jgi:hypothetical protein
MNLQEALIQSGISPNLQDSGPLPVIQDLRKGFAATFKLEDSPADRARLAISHADYLKRKHEIDGSSLHSRMFFRSALILSHEKLLDLSRQDDTHNREQVEEAAALRRFHLARIVVNKVKLQNDVGKYFIERRDLPAKKTYIRVKGLIESAEETIFGQKNYAGVRILNGMLRESSILDALHVLGYTDASQASAGADIYGKQDIIIPGDDAQRALGIQVKRHPDAGTLRIRKMGEVDLEVALGLAPENPFQLNQEQIEALYSGIEETRAA